MKQFFTIFALLILVCLFSSCILLPDAQGGYYTYPIGNDEIEYSRPDGSKIIINQDGIVKEKI